MQNKIFYFGHNSSEVELALKPTNPLDIYSFLIAVGWQGAEEDLHLQGLNKNA